MNFSDDIICYLKETHFSHALRVKIAGPERSIPLRMDVIERWIAHKDIIHLGCVDHLPLIERKIQKNEWFHKRLTERSRRCLGIDINQEGIDYLRDQLGFRDVIHHDILSDRIPQEISSHHWDYLIMGEILEHIDNPVDFLKGIRDRYLGIIDRIILSVPNAFRIDNYRQAKKHYEVINSDHRYWLTPYTTAKLGTQAGFRVESFQFCQGVKPPPHWIVKNFMLKRFPALRDTLVMIMHF